MKTRLTSPTVALAALLILGGTGCSLPKLPSLPKVDIPFIGGDENATPKADDPLVPFQPGQTLGYGHTLDIAVYSGIRSTKQVFKGLVMVDRDGTATIGKHGKVQLGGLKAKDAGKVIEGVFRRHHTILNVQLKRIEDVSLVTVIGGVKQPGVFTWYEGLQAGTMLQAAGGRSTAYGQAVTVTRNGVRRFYSSPAGSGSEGIVLKAGDIVEFSPDL